ncbi:hypothetical protein EGW08_007388 [Elysia chlorotica]|uniref:DUF1868 domain-containing protein n=1 Tax=Elysia chlorotica TaxID=188477 RepID=A0A3S1BC99_ELYCH|nr:hypothetical protein EGW08_007388 [Elysia chlorotica]
MSDKIDSEGNYRPFYGYTVICMVSDLNGMPRLCEDFLQKAPTLQAHMSPLPASSYHATIYDIFTQRDVPTRYTSKSGLVPSPHWTCVYSNLQQDMAQAQDDCEKVKSDWKFHKSEFNIGSQAILIEGTVSNSAELSMVEGKLKENFGDIGKTVKRHHITLGYIFKEFGEEDLKKMKKELQILWEQVPNEILLDAPNVCYFESMTEFLRFRNLQK